MLSGVRNAFYELGVRHPEFEASIERRLAQENRKYRKAIQRFASLSVFQQNAFQSKLMRGKPIPFPKASWPFLKTLKVVPDHVAALHISRETANRIKEKQEATRKEKSVNPLRLAIKPFREKMAELKNGDAMSQFFWLLMASGRRQIALFVSDFQADATGEGVVQTNVPKSRNPQKALSVPLLDSTASEWLRVLQEVRDELALDTDEMARSDISSIINSRCHRFFKKDSFFNQWTDQGKYTVHTIRSVWAAIQYELMQPRATRLEWTSQRLGHENQSTTLAYDHIVLTN